MYNISVRFVLQFKGPHKIKGLELYGIYNHKKINYLGEEITAKVLASVDINKLDDTYTVDYQMVIPHMDCVEPFVNECMSHVTHSLYPHYKVDQDKETYNMNIEITYSVGIQYVSEVDEEYLTETYAEWEYEQEEDIKE